MSQDEHTNIPSKVREQEAQADAALAELEAMMSEGEATLEEQSSVETPANTQDTLLEEPKQQTALTAEPKPVEPKEGGEKTVEDEKKKLEAKYSVLKGKYDSEVPRLAQRLKELEQANEALKDDLDAANEARSTAPDPNASKKYLSDEELSELDEEVLELQSRIAQGTAEDLVTKTTDPLNAKLSEMEKTLSELRAAQSQASDEQFWAAAERLAPGLIEANSTEDQAWLDFLDEIEPVSRLPYRQLGQAAVERGDPAAVANLFNLHKQQSTPEEAAAHVTVESQIKPETVSSLPSTAEAPRGPMIKESEIKNFYSSAAKNRFTEAEVKAKEAEFDLAAAEGRILFGR